MKSATIHVRCAPALAFDFRTECDRLRINESEALRIAIRMWVKDAKSVKTPEPLPWSKEGA